MTIKPIRNEKDYDKALEQVELLMDAKPDTLAYDELEILTTLIESYDAQHYVINMPNSIEAIKFRMEQRGLKEKDLTEIFGNKARVSEVLNCKRKLTLEMIRNLHRDLHIPFENLLKEYHLKAA